MIYLFEYDTQPILFRDTMPLVNELKSFPGWAQCFEKTWLIATNDPIQIVIPRLEKHLLQPHDRLFLLPIGMYTGRLPQEIWDWIINCRNMGF